MHDNEIAELCDAAIKVAASSKLHPYDVIHETMSALNYSIDEKKAVFKRCETYIQSKAQELPWAV